MTLTTEVRVHWPVHAEALLDHVTRVAGGDPATVNRRRHQPGDEEWVRHYHLNNVAGQGLLTLAGVQWSEREDVGDPDEGWHAPPAFVILSIDNPYGFGPDQHRGRWVQANTILPAVANWLDDQGVPRDRWWWEDETAGTWHPGTVDVRQLDSNDPREEWSPPMISR